MGSSYFERLQNLSKEIGDTIYIDTVPGNMSTDDIIKMVVDGEIKYTVADYNIAAINKAYYPILDIETDVSFSQRIAWAVRSNSPELLNTINSWISAIKRNDLYYILYNKYFKNTRSFTKRKNSEYFSKKTGKISRYDDLVKQHSDSINWDWRLLSAMIYKESNFDQNVESWMGAIGLMQLMPPTARKMGAYNPYDPEQNIKAGTKYLQLMLEEWESIPDTIQRIKFALASYNCGVYHVRDAQRLTEKFGGDKKVWDGNVEEFLLKLSNSKFYFDKVVKNGFVRGRVPYQYVKDIFERYEIYKQLVPLNTDTLSQ
jgi:membrane-bound lytic murein transglycosylase F